jgi:hypothetical protein
MVKIDINIEDSKVEEFLEKLKVFVYQNCENSRCITIDNFTIEEYIKHFIIDSE